MRLPLLTLGLALIFLPTMAEARFSAGSYTCSKTVPCESNSLVFSSEQWASYGTSCVAMGFGYSSSTPLFKESGIDSSGCLEPDPEAVSQAMGTNVEPYCCAIPLSSGTCVLRCDLLQK